MSGPRDELLRGKEPESGHLCLFRGEGDGPRPPFAFAGVWRAFDGNYGGERRELVTSSIVTTTPNELVRDTHPVRMPVILHPEDYEAWLSGDPDAAFALIRPFPAMEMVVHQSGEGLKSDKSTP